MSGIPTFQIKGGVPVALDLTFTGLTTFSVALGDWDAANSAWVPRTPYVASQQVSHDTSSYPNIGTVVAGNTALLVVTLSMTSLGGTGSVSTTADLSQNGAPCGEMVTPEASPGPSQAATANMQMYLKAV
jgi:hypothetical protein